MEIYSLELKNTHVINIAAPMLSKSTKDSTTLIKTSFYLSKVTNIALVSRIRLHKRKSSKIHNRVMKSPYGWRIYNVCRYSEIRGFY
jgi:hypothetical protein